MSFYIQNRKIQFVTWDSPATLKWATVKNGYGKFKPN